MTDKNSIIHVLLTGGTIDKHYNQSNGNMEFAETHIESILQQGRNRLNITFEEVMLKDSLDLTDNDREKIAEQCLSSSSKKILITHGTDTMVETAKFLASHQGNVAKEKCIVLVGAMIPHEISYSDATFNIGFALGALSSLNNGIYIAMNGKVFNWNEVQKNYELGEFQST